MTAVRRVYDLKRFSALSSDFLDEFFRYEKASAFLKISNAVSKENHTKTSLGLDMSQKAVDIITPLENIAMEDIGRFSKACFISSSLTSKLD